MIAWIIAALAAFVAWYVVKGRKWLKPKPWMAWLYESAFGEWVELTFFKKSESILWGRFLQALGYGLTLVSQLNGVDLTPLAAVLPDSMAWLVPVSPLLISIAGHVQVQLRMETTKPIELVALPADVPAEVAAAAETVAAVNSDAVAVVQQAKKAGDV